MGENFSPANSFRASILRGERPSLLQTEKQPRLNGSSDALDSAIVPREEVRRGDHRDQDRHRLSAEAAAIRHNGETYAVEVVNLSGGGAMIRTDCELRLWDLVELAFGDGPGLEAAVRWIKDDQFGLEFAHETKIDGDPRVCAELLLEVIQRSFPESEVQLELPEVAADQSSTGQSGEDEGQRNEIRHPLIWTGQILFDFDANPARLRNLSSGGALVDVSSHYPEGAEVVLDLGDAGQFPAIVAWAHGDQAGLSFAEPFDVACLANATPQIAPGQWTKPDFLSCEIEDHSPWNEQWSRSSVAELRSVLKNYLKR